MPNASIIEGFFAMRAEVATIVHRILSTGLELKERLARGDTPDLETEQARLKGMLGDPEARRFPEYAGEAIPEHSVGAAKSLTMLGKGTGDAFLGMRYALICWLDEIFSDDPIWGPQWSEFALEPSTFDMRQRAWKFWEQARKAETRSGDPLEVYYLCVMLGFRGDLRDDPDKLQNWVGATRTQLSRNPAEVFPKVDETEPPTYVPPLHGRERMQRMVVINGLVLLVLILLWSVFLMSKLLT
jgi:type VI secretion system protein ImpK